MTTSSTSLVNLTTLLPQSHDCSCYVSRPVLAPSPLWLQKDCDLRVEDFAHSAYLRNKLRLPNLTCARSWTLCGINRVRIIWLYSSHLFGTVLKILVWCCQFRYVCSLCICVCRLLAMFVGVVHCLQKYFVPVVNHKALHDRVRSCTFLYGVQNNFLRLSPNLYKHLLP